MKDTTAKTNRNGNGNGSSAYATELERPEQGFTGAENSAASETELEPVENYISATDFDAVTMNRGQEASPTETDLEDTGSSSGESAITIAREAYFASYDDVQQEVIIGTDDRVRILNTTVYPWSAICALRMTAANGTKWIGTGWLVGPRTVITAGHCVFMHNEGGWAKSIEVIPGLNDGSRPYGSCVSSNLRSVKGWTQSKKREYDYGAIILPTNCRPGDKTGYFGYAVKDDSFLLSAILNLSGYPGDKGGNQQWFMSKKAKSVSDRVITYEIDTMGGQSGAPVWVKIGDVRYCVGIHTNGHSSGNSATRIVKEVFDNIKGWKAEGA